MIKVGVIGAAGYTGGELIRLLLSHPQVDISLAQSESQSGKYLFEVHKDLVGETEIEFSKSMKVDEVDVLFLCKGHGESEKILGEHPNLLDKKIIDLSQDFRLKGNHSFVYGLPETNRVRIGSAGHVANPGCFATCIQLSLLPSAKSGIINENIHVSGITGSTGAGQALSSTSHFSWRSNNASVYKALKHQHLLEIGETLKSLNGSDHKLMFVPYRGAFTRGIITTSYFETAISQEELIAQYEEWYSDHPFTHVVNQNPDLKQVVGTNKCLIYPQVIDGTAIITAVIDNLVKGASGQAIQNMNLQFGLEETTGLNLKSSAF